MPNIKKNINKGELLAIRYFAINQKKFREHQFYGICVKKRSKTFLIKNKIRKQKVLFTAFYNTPIIQNILHLKKPKKRQQAFIK